LIVRSGLDAGLTTGFARLPDNVRAVPDRVATRNGFRSLSGRALCRQTGIPLGGERSRRGLAGGARFLLRLPAAQVVTERRLEALRPCILRLAHPRTRLPRYVSFTVCGATSPIRTHLGARRSGMLELILNRFQISLYLPLDSA